jgi:ankyrin repeat protein
MAALEKELQPLLHIAAELGIIPFAKACFPSRLSPQQKKAHVDEKDGRELSAIKYAAWRVNYEMVQLLLELEANVDDMTVHVAATYNHPGVLTLLLEHGGNVNAKGVEVDTALDDAAGQGLEHVVDILLKYGADANAMSQSQGLTGSDEVPAIAAAAAMTGHESIVRTLLPKTQNVQQYLEGCLE